MAKSPKRRIVDFAVRALPDAVEADVRRVLGLEVPKASRAAPKALPAPPKTLALPAPGPKLPPFAVKPKGGQWWADKNIGAIRQSDVGVKVQKLPDTDTWVVQEPGNRVKLFGNEDEARAYAQGRADWQNPNRSAENAARRIADEALRLAPDADGPLSQLQVWFNKAAPKYIKNDLGTPDDPMRALAERGSLHVGLSPDEWSEAAKQALRQETIGDVIGLNQLHIPEGALPTAGYDFGANVAINMPWLKKAPVTDKLYGIADTRTLQEQMGMAHLLDEMKNALNPRSGLPPELLLRPESLERMSLPAAAERVSLINKYRAKEMERAALSALDSPAIQTFKEYPENNPLGLRWVELKAPDEIETPEFSIKDQSYTQRGIKIGDDYYNVPFNMETGSADYEGYARDVAKRNALQEALKYEGDTMGHCVGGYCPDVMEGRSRIFSLRDAKGEPHVTIETKPSPRLYSDVVRAVGDKQASEWLDEGLTLGEMVARANVARPEDIIQIKGKQNRAPKDDYLPFVQDFVKSQQWSNVGDLENTGLVRLPDGRYITSQQWKEGLNSVVSPWRNPEQYDERYLSNLSKAEWEYMAPFFEGFAIGGRVDADRCFCHNPLSVKKGR